MVYRHTSFFELSLEILVRYLTIPDLLGDHPIPILVHVLEELLQRGLLPHKLLKAQPPIKITIHPREELCNLLPAMFPSLKQATK